MAPLVTKPLGFITMFGILTTTYAPDGRVLNESLRTTFKDGREMTNQVMLNRAMAAIVRLGPCVLCRNTVTVKTDDGGKVVYTAISNK